MGTGSSIFAEPSGDGAARSSDDEPRSIFRNRPDEGVPADDDGDGEAGSRSIFRERADGEATGGDCAAETTDGEGADDGDAPGMSVFVDGERHEFVVEER